MSLNGFGYNQDS